MGARERKRALRTRLSEVREGIDRAERELLSREVEEAVLALPEIRRAQSVMAFASFGTEVSTGGLIERLQSEGKQVLLPVVIAPEIMEAAEVRPGEALVRSSYGPGEPPGRAPRDPRAIDVVLVPGLGFDRAGRRIGYGGGFYDRFMRRLRPDALRVGLAFGPQLLSEAIPTRPSDEVVDIVVTDHEVVRIEPPRLGLAASSSEA